jgi:uncharacterized membrane protein YkvA (DUF1232 family)
MKSSYETMQEEARAVAGNPSKAAKLAEAVLRLTSSGKYAAQLLAVRHKLIALSKMITCYARKEYTEVPWQTLMLAAAALIYFVSPIDGISDFLPVIGFTDDAAVILAIWSAVSGDVDRFLAWETDRKVVTTEEDRVC